MSKKGVQYTFEGQYYTGSKDTAEQIKNYQLEVVFPEETDKALSIFKTAIRNPLSPICKMMVGKYSDFKAIRTYVITDVKNMDGSNTTEASKNVATMNTKQLTAYIKKNELGIDVEVYEGDIVTQVNGDWTGRVEIPDEPIVVSDVSGFYEDFYNHARVNKRKPRFVLKEDLKSENL